MKNGITTDKAESRNDYHNHQGLPRLPEHYIVIITLQSPIIQNRDSNNCPEQSVKPVWWEKTKFH